MLLPTNDALNKRNSVICEYPIINNQTVGNDSKHRLIASSLKTGMLKQVQHDGNMLAKSVIARHEAPEPRSVAKASKRSEIISVIGRRNDEAISIHFILTFDNFCNNFTGVTQAR